MLPNGTGQDFGRTHGIPTRFDDAVAVALGASARPVDLGRAVFAAAPGPRSARVFANVGSVGMSGAVARRANSMSKRLGGRTVFYYALVREFLVWENTEVTVTSDGGERRGQDARRDRRQRPLARRRHEAGAGRAAPMTGCSTSS